MICRHCGSDISLSNFLLSKPSPAATQLLNVTLYGVSGVLVQDLINSIGGHFRVVASRKAQCALVDSVRVLADCADFFSCVTCLFSSFVHHTILDIRFGFCDVFSLLTFFSGPPMMFFSIRFVSDGYSDSWWLRLLFEWISGVIRIRGIRVTLGRFVCVPSAPCIWAGCSSRSRPRPLNSIFLPTVWASTC